MNNLSIRKASLAVAAVLGLGSPAFGQGTPGQGQQWQIDYGEYRCTLSRRFGAAAAGTLGIRIIPGDDTADLIIINPDWGRGVSLPAAGELVFRPSGTRLAVQASNGAQPSTQHRFMRVSGVERRFFALFAAATGLSIEAEGHTLFSVEFAQAAPAMGALRTCHEDLLRGWGVDPAPLANLRRWPSPIGATAGMMAPSESPASADANNWFGVVRYTVGTDGRVSACQIVRSTGMEDGGRALCSAAMAQARYEPALDADGRAVAVQLVRTTAVVRRRSR